MGFSGFSPKGIELLKRIARNNTKEWFELHRETYEREILAPNRAFVEEMGDHLMALVPTINAIPKTNGSLFRIYRDTRFGTNKAPIKTTIGIIFWQGSGHRMHSSSFYLHYTAQELFVAAGIRRFKPPLLRAYRDILQEPRQRRTLFDLLQEATAKGYHLPKPRYKRLPAGFERSMELADLARYDAIYAYTTRPIDALFFSEAIIDALYHIWEDLLPLQRWCYDLTLHLQERS